jgi:poly(hydroxyalkanoate) depolymerase family esterase
MIEVADFGPNPGRLRMLAYGSARSPERPLIVLLHGCGQNAADFAVDAGWVALADRLGLSLVLPEQAEANNQGRCFQWYQESDTARDRGEAGSIAAMTRAAVARFRAAEDRVFVAGLSAGGAMTAALLATYPDLYAAGAVVAGMPVGAASSAFQALMRMSNPDPLDDPAALARRATRHTPTGFRGAWPRLTVWHGAMDTVVAPENSVLLAEQWRVLSGHPPLPCVERRVAGGHYRAWGMSERPDVELWMLDRQAHGWSLGTGAAHAGRFMLHGPVPATAEIARFWALA